jgi:hypothetical protein
VTTAFGLSGLARQGDRSACGFKVRIGVARTSIHRRFCCCIGTLPAAGVIARSDCASSCDAVALEARKGGRLRRDTDVEPTLLAGSGWVISLPDQVSPRRPGAAIGPTSVET